MALTNNAVLVWNWGTNYFFTSASGANGTVSGSPNGWYAGGGSATVTATPSGNYSFSGWTGDVQGDTNSTTMTLIMDRPHTVSANFAINRPTVTVSSSQGGGYPGTISADYGTALSEWVTNSPVVNGTTQYVCAGATVAGNAYTLTSPTNVTLTLTNNATLTWNWAMNYYLTLGVNGAGTLDRATARLERDRDGHGGHELDLHVLERRHQRRHDQQQPDQCSDDFRAGHHRELHGQFRDPAGDLGLWLAHAGRGTVYL